MTSFVKIKNREKDVVGIVALRHTGVCEETFDVSSKIAQTTQIFQISLSESRNYLQEIMQLRRLSGRFQTQIWRPGEQSPGLSRRVVSTWKALLARCKLVTITDSHLSLRKSTTCMKSSTEYSLFISASTLSDALWTGTCKKLYTRGWRRILAISYRE